MHRNKDYVQSLSASWKAMLKVNCPYCGKVHEISVRETYIDFALDAAVEIPVRAMPALPDLRLRVLRTQAAGPAKRAPTRACCTSTTLHLLLPIKGARPNSARGGKHTRLRSSTFGETCMGETLLLLSCGAAFITGLVIAAASLFG
jgi:hypothetical protein